MDNKNKYLIYKNKYIELKSHQNINIIGGGNARLIPPILLEYVSFSEQHGNIQYNLYDNIKELTDSYILDDNSPRKRSLLELFNKLFGEMFIESHPMQIINTRGNGFCAYNSLYMYLQLTDKQEIIKIITNDDTDRFESFRQQLNLLTKKVLFKDKPLYYTEEIFQETLIGIDDMNAPYVEPIFKAFTQMTGINIILIEANEKNNIFNSTIHTYKDEAPWDYIVLLKKASHIMLIHSHRNEFRIRKQIYENITR